MHAGEDVGRRRQKGKEKLVAGEAGQSRDEDMQVSVAGRGLLGS